MLYDLIIMITPMFIILDMECTAISRYRSLRTSYFQTLHSHFIPNPPLFNLTTPSHPHPQTATRLQATLTEPHDDGPASHDHPRSARNARNARLARALARHQRRRRALHLTMTHDPVARSTHSFPFRFASLRLLACLQPRCAGESATILVRDLRVAICPALFVSVVGDLRDEWMMRWLWSMVGLRGCLGR